MTGKKMLIHVCKNKEISKARISFELHVGCALLGGADQLKVVGPVCSKT